MALQTPDKKKTSEDEFDMDPASIASDKDLHKKVARVREELEAELLSTLARPAVVGMKGGVETWTRERSNIKLMSSTAT